MDLKCDNVHFRKNIIAFIVTYFVDIFNEFNEKALLEISLQSGEYVSEQCPILVGRSMDFDK